MNKKSIHKDFKIAIIWESNGKIKWINRYGRKVLGVKQSDLTKDFSIFSIVPKEEFYSIKKIIYILQNSKAPYIVRTQLLTKNKNKVDVLWYNTILRKDKGKNQILSLLNTAKKLNRRDIRFLQTNKEKFIAYKPLKKIEAVNSLKRALKYNEFYLCYQPIIDLRTKKVTSFEALIRWQHPKKGLIPPLDFIPTAEDVGLIHEIGNWVLKNACEQLKLWHEQGYTEVGVSVNISTIQLERADFVDSIKNILRSTGISPKYLSLEITESILIESLENVLTILQEINDLGIKVYLDDFGTSYSSLKYLKELPIDGIKIDKAFVRDINNIDKDRAIVDLIIQLGQKMNLNIIAEGVETYRQLDFLTNANCHIVQGFLFSKPVIPEEAVKFLKNPDLLM